MTIGMTSQMSACLEFLRERIDARGIAPTYSEIADRLHIKSKSGVTRLINSLVERGAIRRIPNRARAIEVLAPPPPTSIQIDPVPEVRREIERYAALHHVTPKTAIEEACRVYFLEAGAR